MLKAFLRALVKPSVVKVLTRITILQHHLRMGRRVNFGPGFVCNNRLIIRGPGTVVFERDVNAWSHAEKNVLITYDRDARIVIGANTRLNGAGIMAQRGITVGRDCILGSALLVDTDFHSVERDRRISPHPRVLSEPIHIGSNVWLCGQAAVLKGVTIGDNSVVGFRAVVTSDVPANVVVAGNPARVVKHLD